jgi:hypothetical protein
MNGLLLFNNGAKDDAWCCCGNDGGGCCGGAGGANESAPAWAIMYPNCGNIFVYLYQQILMA